MSAKVLVADDSGVMRKIIVRSLASVGIDDVVEARDGQEAISLFARHDFDLVLTDWNMPGMTGIEVISAIREQDRNVPVIMVTTEAERDRVVRAVEAGVSDYLVKPFEREALDEKLKKYLSPSETTS